MQNHTWCVYILYFYAYYARIHVVFQENLHSWQKFYTTAGCDGRDKSQLCWGGGRLKRNGDENISKRQQIRNFWSCSLVDCVLGRWSPEGQWRGKLSPISQRGCSPAATEWCEEEKRKRNSHFLYRKKQVLRTGSQFRKCMRRHPRSACITWNQTRFWFSIKFTHECCWKYSASFVLASGLFGACSASKEFLECTGIIIHHPWLLLILIPQFRIHKYKRQREPPASFPPSPSIKQISCTVNCC